MIKNKIIDKGFIEVNLIYDCEYELFYKVTNTMEKLGCNFIQKVDDFDSLYWDFSFNGSYLVISYSVDFGISIYPKEMIKASIDDNNNVKDISEQIAAIM